ncbi:hypothetical protein DFQ14_105103 [Halopolyspora algeriensis]|uniref:DUF2269 domain-containing protein n=1 Tax=Halopolyspora algeriensis TaxID=1500506 RepID=A0A368VQR4_9ACTN|nr:hypothetical protein [Halopolyspora algeriensis]RCW43958.1 hypothetical protein DFQ14_105103 [Halopolyspora algeriensis]TQM53539.1 hypothetical protein FHU43_1696 [Halopolyspora algeriensis]
MTSYATLAPAGHRWRLGRRTRKTVLVFHIASAGAWLGIDVVMGVLVVTALSTSSERTRAVTYLGLEMFAVWPLLTAGLLCLATGVLLGLGSKYGLVRYWWVATKLVLNVVLATLVLLALRPGIVDAADSGRALLAGASPPLAVGDLVFPPVVSISALLFAMALSVFKPWGRIGNRRGRKREGRNG